MRFCEDSVWLVKTTLPSRKDRRRGTLANQLLCDRNVTSHIFSFPASDFTPACAGPLVFAAGKRIGITSCDVLLLLATGS
jgi:hypothetical protein